MKIKKGLIAILMIAVISIAGSNAAFAASSETTSDEKIISDQDTSGVTTLEKPTIKIAQSKKKYPKITWEKVTGANGYLVYRKKANPAKYYKRIMGEGEKYVKTETNEWKKIAETTKLQYVDEKAPSGVSYVYMVKAYAINKKGTKVTGEASNNVKGIYHKKPKLKSGVNFYSKFKGMESLLSDGFMLSWTGALGTEPTKVYTELYRATSKKGKYKRIKTIKPAKNNIIWFEYVRGTDLRIVYDCPLNIGQWAVADKTVPYGKYYYKVRLFTKLDGKKFYSDYSNVYFPSLRKTQKFKKSQIVYRTEKTKGGAKGSFWGVDLDKDGYLSCDEQGNDNVSSWNKSISKYGE